MTRSVQAIVEQARVEIGGSIPEKPEGLVAWLLIEAERLCRLAEVAYGPVDAGADAEGIDAQYVDEEVVHPLRVAALARQLALELILEHHIQPPAGWNMPVREEGIVGERAGAPVLVTTAYQQLDMAPEASNDLLLSQIDQWIPPLIGRIIREVAEEWGLERFQFVPNREYDPASAPFFHYFGRSDVRIYTGGSDTYLSICDGTLDFYPIPTNEGKGQIAPNECWVIESGRVKDIQDEDTGEEHYLTVYRCLDVTQTL